MNEKSEQFDDVPLEEVSGDQVHQAVNDAERALRAVPADVPVGSGGSAHVADTPRLLWCVNVQGPDDIHAMPNKLAALERANELNVFFGNQPFHENDPIMRAVVIEWPHSPESHAADLLIAKEAAADATAATRCQICGVEGSHQRGCRGIQSRSVEAMAPPLADIPDTELPAMWERADFMGGPDDADDAARGAA